MKKDFINVPFTTCIKRLSSNKVRYFISNFLIIKDNLLFIDCLYNGKWITKKFDLSIYSFCVVSNHANIKDKSLIPVTCEF